MAANTKSGFTMASVFLALFSSISCSTASQPVGAQTRAAANATVSGDFGEFRGTVEPRNNIGLIPSESVEESIENSNLPQLSLVYEADKSTHLLRSELSEEAQLILNRYFKQYLRYCLVENPKGPSHSADNIEYDFQLMRNANIARNALMGTEVSVSTGRRKVSDSEAGALIRYVSEVASNNYEALSPK